MAFILSHLGIRSKMLALILLPLAVLIALAASEIRDLDTEARNQAALLSATKIAVATGNLVHELQAERGASAGFINSQGQNFGDIMRSQRSKTDAQLAALQTEIQQIDIEQFGSDYAQVSGNAFRALDQIKGMRAEIDRQGTTAADVVGFYTALNNGFFATIQNSFAQMTDVDAVHDMSALYFFFLAKDQAGLERAVGAMGFGTGWDAASMVKLARIVEKQDAHLLAFETMGRPDAKAILASARNDPVFDEVNQWRKRAFSGETAAGGSDSWFQIATRKMQSLKAVESEMTKQILAAAQTKAAEALTARDRTAMMLCGLVILLITMGWLITRDLVSSIRRLNRSMEDLAKDNLDIAVPCADRRDEVGAMGRSVVYFHQAAIAKRASDEMLEQVLRRVASSASSIRSGSDEVRVASDDLADRTEHQAANLSEASNAITKIASKVEASATASRDADQSVQMAWQDSLQCKSVAEEAISAMSNIEQGSAKISQIVNYIDSISFQTNLLALNAGVEAARAGDAGKGFAVVASEVRSLALRAAEAAHDIKKLIQENGVQVEAGVRLVKETSDTVSRIAEQVSMAAGQVSAISKSSVEQAAGLGQVTQGVNDLDNITLQNAAMVEQSNAAARSLAEEAARLSDLVAQFNLREKSDGQRTEKPARRLAA